MEYSTYIDALYVCFFLLIPIYSRADYLKTLPDLKKNIGRAKVYKQAVLYINFIGVTSVVLLWFHFISPELSTLKFELTFTWQQNVALALAGAFYFISLAGEKKIRSTPDSAQSLVTGLGDIAAFMPLSGEETRLYKVLSCFAGIWEEIVFRGVLIAILSTYIGVWPAIIASSLMFGWQHFYLGKIHIVKTALVGFILALSYHYTNSLIIPIIFHILLDLISGSQFIAARETANLANANGETKTT